MRDASTLKRFVRDTSGAFAVWAALGTPLILGSAAFSVDASRLYNMEHDLQSGADALARAGAAELDGRGDSLDRAQRAIQRLVRNEQRFSVGGRADVRVAPGGVRFLHTLPASDADAVTSAHTTNDPERAKYVEVRLDVESVDTVFPSDIVAGVVRIDMDAVAVAGRSERLCGVAPVFVCNPYEDTNRTIYEAMDAGDLQKRLIQFKRPTGSARACSSQYGPGSFGYLEIPGYKGAGKMREAVGIDTPDICFGSGDTVRLRTGNIASMDQGFNVRFDIYKGSMKKYRSDPRFAPAANVVKGWTGRTCKTAPDPRNSVGFPRDRCHYRGGCQGWGGNIGKGDWDFVHYVARNHNAPRSIEIEGTTYRMDYRRWTVTPSQPPTRYQMYRWEIDNDRIPGRQTYGNSCLVNEEGRPTCSTVGASTADVDRRIIYAAVLNCRELDHTVGMLPNVDLPVETFVKVFLTEPVGSGSSPTIYGEIVGPVVEGTDSVVAERTEVAR